MKILILFAHPAFGNSIVNARLLAAIKGVKNITLHNLYETYPDFYIDVEAEQALLLKHDVIILHHPLYWYSAPALIKEWMDLVLQHDFAYGHKGTRLKGKLMMNAVSTGGARVAYTEQGSHHHTIRDFLLPFERTAELCHMKYLPPFVVFQGRGMDDQALNLAAESYRETLIALRDERLDTKKLTRFEIINDAVTNIMATG